MNDSLVSTSLGSRLTSKKGAWVSLAISLLGFLLLFGLFGQAKAPNLNSPSALDSESAKVSALLDEFPDSDVQSAMIVVERIDGKMLSESDLAALDSTRAAVAKATGNEVNRPLNSEDGKAAVLVTTLEVGNSNTETAGVVKEIREVIETNTPEGLALYVTGGPVFGADIAAAFDGADFALLAVTILIVAVLLIVTYRSPVLWLIPLGVVGLADGLAGRLTAAVGETFQLQFDAGIISVLVFGAGTNYALLLISRYREELTRYESHRKAMRVAWKATLPAIIASNLTVVVALLTLVLATIPGTHGLGISSAVGLIIVLIAVLFVLPPLLAVCGRKVFWPFIPKFGEEAKQGRVWRGIATRIMRKPVVSLTAGLALLTMMTTGLIGTSVGLNQVEKFRVPSESAAGLEVLSEHFSGGEAQPIFVIAANAHATETITAVKEVDGVLRAHSIAESEDGSLVIIMVTGQYAPGTDESLTLVTELRDTAHEVVGAEALVGGAIAADLDARAGNTADLFLIVPLVLAVSFIVLTLLTRSLTAPILLLLINVLSALAAIGAGSWLSRVLFDQPALDLTVPLLAFLFLVALGIDYTIFLVHRAQTEAASFGTREGMIHAVTRTGAVITSAGIVLAGVFGALGILPLVTLGQLGLIVGLGVIVDTIVVRTVIVPALFGIIGDRIWWPGKLRARAQQ